MYRYLAKRYKYTPNEIANMTLYQQLILCEDDEGGAASEEFPDFDPNDPEAYREWLDNEGLI